jgi:hypothetical protein
MTTDTLLKLDEAIGEMEAINELIILSDFNLYYFL